MWTECQVKLTCLRFAAGDEHVPNMPNVLNVPNVCGLCLFLFTKGPNLRFRAQVSGLLQPAALQPATCGILPSEILKQAGYSALHCLPRFPPRQRNTRPCNTRPRSNTRPRPHRGNGGALNSIRIPIIGILVRGAFLDLSAR